MKKVGKVRFLGLVVLIIGIFLFMTACQPTPEQKSILGKNNVSSGSASSQSSDVENGDNSLYKVLGAPEQWTVESHGSNSKMDININATIVLPTSSHLPIATATLRKITQDDIDVITKAFFDDGTIYREYTTDTKQNIEKHILSIKQELSSSEDLSSDYHDQLETRLRELEAEYAIAPNENDLAKTEPVLKNGFIAPGLDAGECEGFCVSTNNNDKRFVYQAYNDLYGYMTYLSISDGYGDFMPTSGSQPFGVKIQKEEASKQACELISKITDEYELCYVGCTARESSQEVKSNWGWACIFMREINEIPTAYASNEIGEDMEDTNSIPIGYEKMTVVVNDNGIVSLVWNNPMQINSIQTDNANLLPFDQIETLAINAMNNKYADQVEMYDHFEISVDNIELGLMRVKQQNSGSYCYTPVWNIFSKIISATLPDGSQQTFEMPQAYDESGIPLYLPGSFPEVWDPITINAVDGTLIDRSQGY